MAPKTKKDSPMGKSTSGQPQTEAVSTSAECTSMLAYLNHTRDASGQTMPMKSAHPRARPSAREIHRPVAHDQMAMETMRGRKSARHQA